MDRPTRLLVVCTANICRSPMAEALLKHEGRRQDKALELRSGGTLNLIGRPAADNSVRAMEEIGLPLDHHRSKGIGREDIAWADHILVMELRHQRDLHTRFPDSEGKVLLFGTFGGAHEVSDPVNRWMFRFRRTRALLQRSAERFVAQLP